MNSSRSPSSEDFGLNSRHEDDPVREIFIRPGIGDQLKRFEQFRNRRSQSDFQYAREMPASGEVVHQVPRHAADVAGHEDAAFRFNPLQQFRVLRSVGRSVVATDRDRVQWIDRRSGVVPMDGIEHFAGYVLIEQERQHGSGSAMRRERMPASFHPVAAEVPPVVAEGLANGSHQDRGRTVPGTGPLPPGSPGRTR